VTKADLRIDVYRGSGAGGQHRNKTSTAVRITHIPTGLSSTCETHKSQVQNKREAFRKLADKLVPMMKEALRTVEVPSVCTERVRTYHLEDNRVTDHRVPKKRWDPKRVLDGDLDDIIRSVRLGID
jgi:peptide chain release factor 1